MARRPARGVLGSVALALLLAEGGRRVLAPRGGTIEPARVELRAYFSDAEIDRGARFARPQLALGLLRGAVDFAALAALVWRAPPVLRQRQERPVLAGGAAAAAMTVALTIPPLPVAAIARRRAIAVGLVTQSWRGWAVDLVKASAIEAGLTASLGAGAIALIRRYPRDWWLPVAGGAVLAGAALATLAPVVVDPVFNDFTPLPEGETRDDVLELAADAGVKVREVYSVDASRRSTAANAYVNGLGPTKRVVLFDTLLDRYSRDEVRVVVAHELAHVRHRDVPRGMLFVALVAPAAVRAIQQLSWALSDEHAGPAMLPALAMSAAIVSAPLGMIGNGLSRAVERRADAFALRLTDAPDAFVSFERTIALQNVADLDPPRAVQRLLATHPSTTERIGFAVGYSASRPGSPGP